MDPLHRNLVNQIQPGSFATDLRTQHPSRCNLFNLQQVEAEVLGSLLGREFEVYLSFGGYTEPEVKPGFCARSAAKIVAGADFNGRKWTPP